MLTDFPKLTTDLLKQEIVIIGSGIAGALIAHELCSAGFSCCIIDKRLLSSGSTLASTAHINYELDTHMYDLAKLYNEKFAVAVYRACVQSVSDLAAVFETTGVDADFQHRPSLYLSSDKNGRKQLEREYKMRTQHGIPAELLNAADLESQYNIDRKTALYHAHSGQIDSYKAAAGLIMHHVNKGKLKVYTRTAITRIDIENVGVTLTTDNGYRINTRYVVCAAGYEARDFLPKKVMNLQSTYALVTPPVPRELLWKDICLIWETARPYFYMRTTTDNRIIMGGEDLPFKNARLRDALLEKKTAVLLEKSSDLFPYIPVHAEFDWCGTFSETEDGMPYIGQYPGMKNVFFALGYGGNGTTFSMIAAQVIANILQGKPDERASLFGFDR